MICAPTQQPVGKVIANVTNQV